MPTQRPLKSRLKPLQLIRPQALISHSTILILSVFLLGLQSGRWQTTGPDPFLVGVSLFGIICWMGLGLLAQKRKEKESERILNETIAQIENRVDRHVTRVPAPGSERVEPSKPQPALSIAVKS